MNSNMSVKEMEQVHIFEKLIRKEISQKSAAERLNLSDRQVRNKVKQYKIAGAKSLIHKNRGKVSRVKWDTEQEKFAIQLLKTDWEGFGPTFAAEKLKDIYKIETNKETLRQAMIKANLWTAKPNKPKHRSRRERKPSFGMMIQLDGSPHDWFEGRSPECTLLVFIDDATSLIVHLEFVKGESVEAVMQATRKYIEKYGKPGAFYVDYGGVFSVNLNNAERDKKTQFERALRELNIGIIHASSPQAKGRVERSNKTHQDRLIKEMRIAKISNIVDANIFLENKYRLPHNRKFAIAPAEPTDLHIPVSKDINLDNIFCLKDERILTNDFTIVYKKRQIQLGKYQSTILRPKDRILVKEHFNGSITLSIRKTELDFNYIDARKKIVPTLVAWDKIRKVHPKSRQWAASGFNKVNPEVEMQK